jgi:hypothetical protein
MAIVDLITRDCLITHETTFDAWIAGFTPSNADGHVFYALSYDSMHALFNAARGVSPGAPARPIGFHQRSSV